MFNSIFLNFKGILYEHIITILQMFMLLSYIFVKANGRWTEAMLKITFNETMKPEYEFKKGRSTFFPITNMHCNFLFRASKKIDLELKDLFHLLN